MQKMGDQTLFIDQARLLRPMIDTQQESSKNIVEKLMINQDAITNALVPLQRRMDVLQSPLAIEEAAHSTPIKTQDIINVNLDNDLLNDTHRENLQDMSLDYPSEVQKKGNIQETLDKIEKNNRTYGQFLRADSKKSQKKKEIYKSRQETLKIYKQSIEAIQRAQKFIQKSGEGLVQEKRGKGRPRKNPVRIFYRNGSDLCVKLGELVAAKNSGNTALDKTISAILDELLNKKLISNCDYNELIKSIFSS
jgi:hypothetical protein